MKLSFRSFFFQVLVVVGCITPSVHAETSPEDPAEEAEPPSAEEPGFLTKHTIGAETAERTGLSIRGWLDQGFTGNVESQESTFNGPLSFNDRANEYQMNQFYLVAERAIDKSSGVFDLGGRVDLLYGTDAVFTQATGLDNEILGDGTSRFYKLAIPQFYLEALVPIGSGLTVKAGHFYTLIGYEVVTAPDNFFYSHAFTMQYGEPFTHTGVLASYQVGDSVTVTGGAIRGWDNFSDSGKGTGFLGSVGWSSDGSALTLAVTSGNEATNLNRTMYSLVYSQDFCGDWKWVVQHDWAYQEGGDPTKPGSPAHWYGVNQYLTYKLSDEISLGTRVEWFRDNDGVRVSGVRSLSPASPSDFVGLTIGANYYATSYLKIRPEVRYDYQRRSDSSAPAAYGDGDSVNQWTAAIDAIVSF